VHEKPENWIRIIKETAFSFISFCNSWSLCAVTKQLYMVSCIKQFTSKMYLCFHGLYIYIYNSEIFVSQKMFKISCHDHTYTGHLFMYRCLLMDDVCTAFDVTNSMEHSP